MVIDDLSWDVSPEYSSEKSRAAYYSGEEFSFVKFVGLNGEGISKEVSLDRDNTNFEIPIYLIQGKEDLLTVSDVTKEYFDVITAPLKELIFVEKTGHDPNNMMLRVQLKMLKNGIKASPL